MTRLVETLSIPGLLVVGTDTGVGKTLIARAIAQWLGHDGHRVAVCKPVATGCVRRREGLVSEDAEFLAYAGAARHPLDLICPQRYAEPLAPAIAAERAKRPLDWEAIDRAIRLMSRQSDVMVIEGIGGVMVPLDADHTFLDLARWLGVPAIVVARAGLGTISHTLLTLEALQGHKIRVAGVVINRYPADTPSAAEETNPRAIEKWGRVPILSIVPEAAMPTNVLKAPPIPPSVAAAIKPVDWWALAKGPDDHDIPF